MMHTKVVQFILSACTENKDMLLLVTAVGGVVLCMAFLRSLIRSKKTSSDRFLEPGCPPDTVVLHQFGPGPDVPSISAFVMKLETYLRAANIPYVNKFDRKVGPKGKIPWIQYNDQVVPDSQHCIEFLNDKLGVDLNRHLSKDQLAVGHILRRSVEEFLYWSTVLHRLSFDAKSVLYRQVGLPRLVIWYLRSESHKRASAHGIGRNSQAEVVKMTQDDLQAISMILGTKRFLFGESKEEVTEADCAVFGQLCEIVWGTPNNTLADDLKEKYPNLYKYCCNMKETFWPDWDDRLLGAKPNLTTNGTPKVTPTERKSRIPLRRCESTNSDDVLSTEPMKKNFSESEVMRCRIAKNNNAA